MLCWDDLTLLRRMTDSPLMQRHSILTVEAVRVWQPDASCIAAGDEHATLAVRCYAAGGCGDAAIAQRMRLFVVDLDPQDVGRYNAAFAVARHGVIVGASDSDIVRCLAQLALELPDWPDDPEELAWITRTARREAGR
jgi:hypothetical protein